MNRGVPNKYLKPSRKLFRGLNLNEFIPFRYLKIYFYNITIYFPQHK